MGFRGRVHLIIVMILILLTVNTSKCLADELFDVVLGQDTVFSYGNITDASGDAVSNGSSAYAQVSAGPYSSGISTAKAGVRFRVVEGPEGLDYALANISITFTYNIVVDFFDILPPTEGGGGSADASVSAYVGGAGADMELVSHISFTHYANYDEDSGTRTVVGENNGLYAGNLVDVNTELYAHADVYKGNYALARADTQLIEVRIHFITPVDAKFSISPETPYLGDTITFDSSESEGEEFVSWEWDFGDGSTASGPVVTHSYENRGTYTVRLTITDINGQTGSAERDLIFEPGINKNKAFLNFLVFTVDGNISKIEPQFEWVNITNAETATADLHITDVKVEGEVASEIEFSENCKGEELFKGCSCQISPIIVKDKNEGIAYLKIYYDGNGSPLQIPIQVKVIGLNSEKEAEFTKKISQILKGMIQNNGVPIPPPLIFFDRIQDFAPLPGKTWFFGTPAVGPLQMSEEIAEEWPTTVWFENVLSTFSLEDGTVISYLPYSVIEGDDEDEGGVALVNYVDIEGGDGWFTRIDENSEFNIDTLSVPAYDFTLFKTYGEHAQGYNIKYCVDMDGICDITLLEGSPNVFDIAESIKADMDTDRDVDGKDLSDFIIKAINGLPEADFNNDGEINMDDLRLFIAVFGSRDS